MWFLLVSLILLLSTYCIFLLRCLAPHSRTPKSCVAPLPSQETKPAYPCRRYPFRPPHLDFFHSQFHLPNTKHAMTTQFLLRRPVLRPVELLPRILCAATPNSALRMLSTHPPKPEEEDAIYATEVEGVKRWWAEPRWKGITRPYSAGDVVSKRGTLKQHYPSSQTARKLFELLNERAAQGLPVHTSITLFILGGMA